MSKDTGLVAYFGFGSLVNEDTLRTSYQASVPATLKGWRRHWQARTATLEDDVALLSIHQDDSCNILGVLVVDLAENLAAVDEREAGYTRRSLKLDDLELPNGFDVPDQLYVYVADEDSAKKDEGALLQSYLDAVLQGFHRIYGTAGVQHFVETTSGFQRSVIADRAAPRYPRNVLLDAEQAELFDTAIVSAGATLQS